MEGYRDGGRILKNLSIPSNCSQVVASVALFLVMVFNEYLKNIILLKHSFILVTCLIYLALSAAVPVFIHLPKALVLANSWGNSRILCCWSGHLRHTC